MSVLELTPPEVVTPLPHGGPPRDPYADPPPDALFEVVNGERVEKAVSLIEQLIAVRLVVRLEPFCRDRGIGHAVTETTFAIPSRGNDRKPDVAFVSYQSWPEDRPIPRVNAWPVVPDVTVEVVSPSDKAFDVLDKLEEYFEAGVRQAWLIFSHVGRAYRYTSPTEVRVLSAADELDFEPLVPGFRLPLAELFPLVEG